MYSGKLENLPHTHVPKEPTEYPVIVNTYISMDYTIKHSFLYKKDFIILCKKFGLTN